jgi:hypothetical protein
VGVIPFPVWPVYCHVDRNAENTITRWLDQNGVSSELRASLQAQIDILQSCDPNVVPGLIVQVGSEFEAFRGVRKGEEPVYLAFRRGIYTECEITILSASHTKKGTLPEARLNLDAVRRDRRRRVYEPVTRRPSRNFSR